MAIKSYYLLLVNYYLIWLNFLLMIIWLTFQGYSDLKIKKNIKWTIYCKNIVMNQVNKFLQRNNFYLYNEQWWQNTDR